MRAPPLVLALGLAAAPALAQPGAGAGGSTCNVQIDTMRRSNIHLEQGVYQTFAGGGVWAHCREQPTTMYSDSVAWYPERNLLYLVDHVRFQDSTSLLNADRVTYFVSQERLYSQGHVYTKNLKTRSDLRGPNLDYFRVAPGIRDTLELHATGRPTIHFYSARRADAPPPAAPADTEPFVVVADRARMRGEDRMWGGGHVTVDRSDVAARGDSAQLDLGTSRGALVGSPRIDGTGKDAYHLTGRLITFRLNEQHEIRGVLSSGEATALGPDWRLDADTLDMALDSGKVQRAQAWGRTRRPTAVSGVHTIVADSLDIHMPAQVVRLVWGYGRARTTSRDSASSDEDWMVGDTMRADFAVKTDSAQRQKSELEDLTAFGSARSLYHVTNDQNPQGPKGMNYARAKRIHIAMDSSKVHTVDFVGLVDGLYLEPQPPQADTGRAAGDTAGAATDTSRGRGVTASDSTRRIGADSTHRMPADSTRRLPADSTRRPPADSTRPVPPDSTRHPRRDTTFTPGRRP